MQNTGRLQVNTAPSEHISVLSNFAREIKLSSDAVVFDATTGCGGHSAIFAESLGKNGTLICLDVDQNSLDIAKQRLADFDCKKNFVRENFAAIKNVLEKLNIDKVDLIFADLGFCSAQLNDTDIGLSFSQNGKLDMRLDNRLAVTAADIINSTDEKGLADLIYKYGQERASRKIARCIVSARKKKKFETTLELVDIICKATGIPAKCRKSKIHPATRTFQALRIAVNFELDNLEALLNAAPDVLAQNGKIAVISFHSLEDRIVKYDFRQNKIDGIYNILTKKPAIAQQEEIEQNPRARSAKLRMAARI